MHRLTTACTALVLAALGSVLIAADSGNEKTRRVEFARDSKGGVSGYGIWFDWEWNVRFARRDP
jgi:hypothetical protein